MSINSNAPWSVKDNNSNGLTHSTHALYSLPNKDSPQSMCEVLPLSAQENSILLFQPVDSTLLPVEETKSDDTRLDEVL